MYSHNNEDNSCVLDGPDFLGLNCRLRRLPLLRWAYVILKCTVLVLTLAPGFRLMKTIGQVPDVDHHHSQYEIKLSLLAHYHKNN